MSESGRERRRFERVGIAYQQNVEVLEKKKKVGILRQIARGGLMMEPEKTFTKGKKYKLTIFDKDDDIRIPVEVVVRYADTRYVGLEFVDLDPDAAVEIGILIGKYYDYEDARV